MRVAVGVNLSWPLQSELVSYIIEMVNTRS